MKITAINLQVRDQNRVNVSVDGVFLCSLDIAQIIDLGLKVGLEIDDTDVESLKSQSEFGKYYQRALEFCLMRPRSKREVSEYLYKKTMSKIDKLGKLRNGMNPSQKEPIIGRLVDKGYVDDFKFAKYWVQNRFLKKGLSQRRLSFELSKKGIAAEIIEQVLGDSDRNDQTEIQKIIVKKRNKYDEKGLMSYLSRQGFSYSDIKSALEKTD